MNQETKFYKCPEVEKVLGDSLSVLGNHFAEESCIANLLWEKCTGSCKRTYLKNLQYHSLMIYAQDDGYTEYDIQYVPAKKGGLKKVKKVVEGFFVNQENTSVIICDNVNEELIPYIISSKIQNTIKAENLYEGYEFLLVFAEHKISSFKIILYQKIIELIRLINLHVDCSIQQIELNIEKTVLIISTEQIKFLISANLTPETEEIERTILSTKLDVAKPFFEFKPIQKVDWSKLKDNKGNYFEKLVETLLSLEINLSEIKPIGKTNASDRGRDFIVTEKEIDAFGIEKNITWLVQCKFSEKSISNKSIPDWITRTIEHKVDGYWLITNNDLTPNLFDQLTEIPKNPSYNIKCKFWQRSTFDIKLRTRPEIFSSKLFFTK